MGPHIVMSLVRLSSHTIARGIVNTSLWSKRRTQHGWGTSTTRGGIVTFATDITSQRAHCTVVRIAELIIVSLARVRLANFAKVLELGDIIVSAVSSDNIVDSRACFKAGSTP